MSFKNVRVLNGTVSTYRLESQKKNKVDREKSQTFIDNY